ncbi:jg26426 [Pararge aegeria aegeria]|uniref:Jg26426 protein n=1 Tax=Pararge aegeria aegeria TaxID=348720 RepID=A0A8S4SGK4_9NEOP|nr:jg26426 [Pararge aegeria aegeria]
MVSDDAAQGGARLPRRCLFTLDLKVLILYVLEKMEAGRAFQILAVRIRNEDAKRFVRVRVIYGCREIKQFLSTLPEVYPIENDVCIIVVCLFIY